MPEPAAFVTGGSGFIGRHLVRELLRRGRTVLALCRDPSAIGQPEGPSLRLIRGALEQPEQKSEVLGPYLNIALDDIDHELLPHLAERARLDALLRAAQGELAALIGRAA